MADWGRGRGDSRSQAETQVATWDAAAQRRRGLVLAGGRLRFDHAASERLWRWAVADTGPGRLLPWLPVAFGLGIALYFTAEREPLWWAGTGLTAICCVAVFMLRHRPVAFPLALAAAAMAAGFTVATLKTLQVAHPVLARPASVALTGFVEVREERERSDRVVIRVSSLEGYRLNHKPDRVRVSVRKGTAPPVGAYVNLRARLSPPLEPLRPGGYDFARDLYFQGIGATGFALGAVRIAQPPAPPGTWLRYATALQGLRDAIDDRIRAVVPGDRGAIASALITGKRDAISAPVNDAMYVSSLGHVLSISGYHMAVVAGVVFFVLRALLALVPAFATGRPIKKWAAAGALVAAAAYLLLSGSEVATQRSFIMTAIVLVGVMADRPALTLRTLALAAFAVLLLAPQSLVHPSFQMSFAATLALIAAYERGLPWMVAGADTSAGARVALWGGREIVGLIFASLVAGLATTPYAAFHFHRLAPYGVVANLLAMPIVSIWVMPAGLLGLIAIPFGFDAMLWRLMGEGIDWMIAVALFVAHLPGAVGHVAAFGTGPLLLGTGGLAVICLLKTPLRWCGAAMIVVASLWAIEAPQPDVLVAADGQALAVRGPDGQLWIHRGNRDAFAAREWLAADGDARVATDKSLGEGFNCDEAGCMAVLADGRLVSYAIAPDAFEEDCVRAAVVVTAREAPPDCAALTIDRTMSQAKGAIALRRNGKGWEIAAGRPAGENRPWAPASAAPKAQASPAVRTAPRDATPRVEDLEAGD
jgi:competence protein ComEC